jgi:hypothetical protein
MTAADRNHTADAPAPCCTVNCTAPARWEVDLDRNGPDTGTLACDGHLAQMASDYGTEHLVIRPR